MKQIMVLIAALILAPQGACVYGVEQGTDGVRSSISAVTVYEDRALVRRSAALQLEAGQREVVFEGLPALLVDDSLRASGEGAARVTIVGLQVERQFLRDAKDERVRAVEKEIEQIEEEDRSLEDRAAAIDIQMKFVDSIKSSVGEGISREMLLRVPEPEQWKGVVSFLGDEYGALAPQRRTAQKRSRELKKEIGAAKKKLREMISAMPREQKDIRVALEVSRAGRFTLELSYMVSGASWRPCYDARADREKGSVDLVYCGQVRQKTGEDWNDVSLELSTARPSIGGTPPDIEPWYVSFERYRPLVKGRAVAAAPVALFEDKGEAPERFTAEEELIVADEQARVATAEIGRRGEAVTFTIKRRETIAGDNSLHKTVIAPITMKAAYSYFSVPKLVEKAYLMARVKNEAAYPLLGGPVSVFLGPEYVGASSLEHVVPGEEFDLYLGVDDGVTVKRTLLTEEAERSLVKRRTGWKYFRYRIDVENHRDVREKVTVEDQIPVSREPDITVKLEEATPPPVTVAEREKPGIVHWVVEPGPGEKKTIEFEFSVSYPKEKKIEGLI